MARPPSTDNPALLPPRQLHKTFHGYDQGCQACVEEQADDAVRNSIPKARTRIIGAAYGPVQGNAERRP